MPTKKTSLRIDEKLLDQVKRASRRWAEREGLSPDGQVTQWVTRWLRRGVREELAQQGRPGAT